VTEPREPGALAHLLEAVAGRSAAAGRIEPEGGEAVLRSVAEATVALFDSEAASLVLHEPETDRLVIRVAAGPAGEGAVGLAFPATEGIAGYVFTTGLPLVVSDTSQDTRFDRTTAQSSGYVPRSILAVPMVDDAGTIGVLEVLDKRGDEGFGLRDLDLAAVFARQATVAIRAARVERDTAALLRLVLERLAGDRATGAAGVDAAVIDAAVADAVAALDTSGDDPLWRLADAVARARAASPEQVDLVVDILDALARRAVRPTGRSFRR
jgi:GAF domain-containing protein